MAETRRKRLIYQWWYRSPGGKYLDKYDAPLGKRTPNGFVWGHCLDDLFMIQRIPGMNVVTCWSRSMIRELGERPIEDEEGPDTPRIRRPYPLLRIDKDVDCPESSMYSCLDEGSDHEDPIPIDDLEDAKGKQKEDYIYQGKNGNIHRCLEEHIPQQFFPDRLIVTDPCHLAFGKGELPQKDGEPRREPWIYERLYPSFSRDWSADRFAEDPLTAELSLNPEEVIGVGHHSNVYRATLTLPKGLSARTPDGKVTVVAKTAFPRSEHRDLLHNEAKIFCSFPRHLSEEWCGYNVVTPLISWPVPVGPVVPKFYGYYMPIGEKKDVLSPILLMEECGTPVDPQELTSEEKTECHSLFLRFHSAGYLHQSTYIRNVVMQPGPLTRHPDERSRLTPSFRLIDFGRSTNLEEEVAKAGSEEGLTEEQIKKEKTKVCGTLRMERTQEEMSIGREFCVGPQFAGY